MTSRLSALVVLAVVAALLGLLAPGTLSAAFGVFGGRREEGAAGLAQLHVSPLDASRAAELVKRFGSPPNALLAATRAGQVLDLRALIAAGADVNAVNANNENALIIASGNGNLGIVQLLLDGGAHVNVGGDHARGWAALRFAASHGHRQVVDVLLAAGATVDAAEAGGETALIWAVRYGHAPIVASLIAAGADPNALDSEGDSALTGAWRNFASGLDSRVSIAISCAENGPC